MSTELVRKSEISSGPPVGARSRLEITLAVKNKKTGKWETPQLADEEKRSLRNAIEAIRHQGQLKKFEEDGAVLEVTKNGIFVKEGRDWKDLLNDQTVKGETRREVKKTLSTVTKVVGDLSKTKDKFELKNQETLKTLVGSGDVVIEVHVVPTANVFDQHFNEEWYANEQISEFNERIRNTDQVAAFHQYGFPDDQISRMQGRMAKLASASQEVTNLMQEVRDLLFLKSTKQAIELYKKMPSHYEVYCDAMRDWQKEQKILDGWLGETNPYRIDINRPNFQEAVAKELFFYAEKAISDQVDTSKTLQQISILKTSYFNFLRLEKFIEQKNNELYERETKFNAEVRQAFETLNDPNFIHTMLKMGWLVDEINPYKEKLVLLKTQSDEVLTILRETANFLFAGDVQGGMDYYTYWMAVSYPSYVDACSQLIIPQQVAKGRTLGERWPSFSLNLEYPALHKTFLDELIKETKEAEIVDVKFAEVVNMQAWINTQEILKAQTEALIAANKYPTVAQHINYVQNRSKEFTRQIGGFVKGYNDYRELFEFIMRKHGISDVQSSLIFNHYYETYEALNDWNTRFQVIVDLANQKKYQEAVEAYTNLINTKFPALVAKVRNVIFGFNNFKKMEVSTAFREFAMVANLPNPEKLFRLLSTERLATNVKNEFLDCLKLDGAKPEQLSQSIDTASKIASVQLEEMNKDLKEFERLFVQDARFIRFFNFGNVMSDPDSKTIWNTILHKYGWSTAEMQAFTYLYNQYAQVIRPLKEAEQAINVEVDPQKKRALQSQRKELAKELMPEVQKLHQGMRELGGLKKLGTIQAAAKEIAERTTGDLSLTKSELGKFYKLHEKENKLLGFEDAEALINSLQVYLDSLPADQKSTMEKIYVLEIKLVRQIKFAEGVQAEAAYLVELIKDRTEYLDKLFAELGFFSPWKFGTINSTLLEGSHARDEKFLKLLSSRGWDKARIQQLSKWYDSYIRESLPLSQAKTVLEADPENPLLQKEFQKVADKQLPKLNRLSKEFTQKIGGMQKLRELEWALSLYINQIASESKNLSNSLSDSTLEETQKAVLVKRKTELESSLKIISSFNVVDVIVKTNAMAFEANLMTSLPMSWDSNLLKPITDRKSPLMQIKSHEGGSLWERILKDNNLEKQEVASIVELYQSYQSQLQKIVELEREQETHPEDDRILRDLLRELHARKGELLSLENQFVKKIESIIKLQSALNTLNQYLKDMLKKIEERPDLSIGNEDFIRLLIKIEEFQIKQLTGNLSNDEMQGLIRLIDELNIMHAFNQKRAILSEMNSRFGKFL